MQIKFQSALRKTWLMILPKIINEGRDNLHTSKFNTMFLKKEREREIGICSVANC